MRGDPLARQWWGVQVIEASPNGLTVAELAKHSPFMDVFKFQFPQKLKEFLALSPLKSWLTFYPARERP